MINVKVLRHEAKSNTEDHIRRIGMILDEVFYDSTWNEDLKFDVTLPVESKGFAPMSGDEPAYKLIKFNSKLLHTVVKSYLTSMKDVKGIKSVDYYFEDGSYEVSFELDA